MRACEDGDTIIAGGEEILAMRQTVKARYHDGVLEPLEPLALADDTEMQVTVESGGAVGADEILERAAQVYQGLTPDQIAHIETLALDRRRFFHEPAA
jgi:predicted DNA-binding antitoxin AbrB/MazE fold protein